MKSILIVGLGRFGRHMAHKFVEQGHSVLAIEKSEERADNAIKIVPNIQIGDAANEDFAESLGVRNFDLCVIAIGDNFQASLEITVLFKDLGAKFILARASRDVHRKLLLRNGADHVVYAEREMAERLAVKYGSKNLFDYVELIGTDSAIYEMRVPENWYGKSIIEKSIRTRYHISILATKKNGKIYPLPQPDHIFTPDETLIVLGGKDAAKALLK
ncbi:TrkA family potassium uptake protein [Chakrabartyella piscis]|uniref:potassium channel family protein n=1 Tax=Chakrabartyella piscis TaxID=2918914 RepID=UPI0029588196|nr:TrkA family potassium uptake protein [Chakrabartyella piscis]